MNLYRSDLHIHVGMSESGRWIKIPTSARLTVHHILQESIAKGLNLIAIIDALSPLVQQDITALIEIGLLQPLSGGGYHYADEQGEVSMILGAEIETTEAQGGSCHTLIYLPDLQTMQKFTTQMSRHIKNVNMSSQNAHMSFAQLIDIASSYDALVVPAHVFTPFKSIFGSVTDRISSLLSDKQLANITAVEIGLSADSMLADRIGEVCNFTLLSNSDAHSLDKIGREFNIFSMESTAFTEYGKVLKRLAGRKITANYGMDPRLGKYHATVCLDCGSHEIVSNKGLHQFVCNACSGTRIVRGVFDRIADIADFPIPHHPDFRPPYFYQIPLSFLPGLGPKTVGKLRQAFSSEIYVLHQASFEELSQATNAKVATTIMNGRSGKLQLNAGGGGVYGKVYENK